jgi:hypothetical protein
VRPSSLPQAGSQGKREERRANFFWARFLEAAFAAPNLKIIHFFSAPLNANTRGAESTAVHTNRTGTEPVPPVRKIIQSCASLWWLKKGRLNPHPRLRRECGTRKLNGFRLGDVEGCATRHP